MFGGFGQSKIFSNAGPRPENHEHLESTISWAVVVLAVGATRQHPETKFRQ